MEGMEQLCFQIITNVGTARSMYVMAIEKAKAGEFEAAHELINQGDEHFSNGHKFHGDLIQQEAAGESISIDLLLLHAEDQLMAAESFKTIALEFIDVYKRMS